MEILIGLIISAGIGAIIGQHKGRTVAGFLWGFLLGPIGWLIIALAGGGQKQCPSCRSWVDRNASVCPKCGRDIAPVPGQATPQAASTTGFCPYCGAPRHEGPYCAACGKPLHAGSTAAPASRPVPSRQPAVEPTVSDKGKRGTKKIVYAALAVVGLIAFAGVAMYLYLLHLPSVPRHPKAAVSVSPNCFSVSGKPSDIIFVAKLAAARQDLDCAVQLLNYVPVQDPLHPEAQRLLAQYRGTAQRAEEIPAWLKQDLATMGADMETYQKVASPGATGTDLDQVALEQVRIVLTDMRRNAQKALDDTRRNSSPDWLRPKLPQYRSGLLEIRKGAETQLSTWKGGDPSAIIIGGKQIKRGLHKLTEFAESLPRAAKSN